MNLPIWQTAVEILDYVWHERRALVRFGAIPLAIVVLLVWAIRASGWLASQPQSVSGVVSLAQLLIFLPLTVSWYRMVVLGDAAASQRPMFAMGRLEWRLLLWQV